MMIVAIQRESLQVCFCDDNESTSNESTSYPGKRHTYKKKGTGKGNREGEKKMADCAATKTSIHLQKQCAFFGNGMKWVY